MNNDGQKIAMHRTCHPDGARPVDGVHATKIALLTELEAAMLRYGINDLRLFYENDARFLKQF